MLGCSSFERKINLLLHIFQLFTHIEVHAGICHISGRDESLIGSVSSKHAVNKNSMKAPFPEDTEMAMFGESICLMLGSH